MTKKELYLYQADEMSKMLFIDTMFFPCFSFFYDEITLTYQ